MITEAMEAAGTKEEALANLAYQVKRGETLSVIGLYEQAAIFYGATPEECDLTIMDSVGGL